MKRYETYVPKVENAKLFDIDINNEERKFIFQMRTKNMHINVYVVGAN